MSDDPTNSAAPEPEPEDTTGAKATKLSKKKRRRGAPSETTVPTRLPGEGTVEGEKLREANAAFEAGNYALVRTLTSELERASDPTIVDAARDLARRTAVDPLQMTFLVLCAVALLVITYVYVLR
ncbi:hypothetical protein [Sandaracinus amylolyticus]|uniref:hypothetical protein n=1 Tax=Sandaracinus amylolyticus TaxID=927083 RepID=UPI0012ED2D51|nr:hypothetical protein [Sandaracinus amylolyticus]